MITVYIAGSSKRLEMIKDTISKFRDAGFEIKYDWPPIAETELHTEDISPTILAESASSCINAARTADVTIYMSSPEESLGSMMELGASLASNKLAIICEEYGEFAHFFRWVKDLYIYPKLEDVLDLLNAIKREAEELANTFDQSFSFNSIEPEDLSENF